MKTRIARKLLTRWARQQHEQTIVETDRYLADPENYANTEIRNTYRKNTIGRALRLYLRACTRLHIAGPYFWCRDKYVWRWAWQLRATDPGKKKGRLAFAVRHKRFCCDSYKTH